MTAAARPPTLHEMLRGWEPTGPDEVVRLEVATSVAFDMSPGGGARTVRTVQIWTDAGQMGGKRSHWRKLGPVIVDDTSWATTLHCIGQVLDELATRREQ